MNQLGLNAVTIPERLREKLATDPRTLALADQFVLNFNQWLGHSRTPFFNNYTDHGPRHINAILASQVELITQGAWATITPTDALLITLASCAHDCALHLNEVGFIFLSSENYRLKKKRGFDDPAWSIIWRNFLSEAKHFDLITRVRIYGVDHTPNEPPPDPFDWTEFDRRLIGEFVRRNHPRMAHEFLVDGVPGKDGVHFFVNSDADRFIQEHLDLAGIIARSHGFSLRYMADLMRTPGYQALSVGVHPIYLMALLRIADYLHISSDRAAPEWLRFKDIRNRYSSEEWELNQCVKSAIWSNKDPEAIEIIANPPNAKLYVRLKHLLNAIQAELDVTWATLGEYYGLQWHTAHLTLGLEGLKVRRLRSAVQDPQEFADAFNPEYVPDEFSFTVDDARLMKLLVGPLYDHDHSKGLRELIQNAVDAVRERDAISEAQNQTAHVIPSEPSIVIRLRYDGNSEPAYLDVIDAGLGMTEAIVKKYFLRVGATFVNTEEWSRRFAGRSVIRTGRFGVGALAAFLLGDSILVRTRHYSVDRGVEFQVRPDNDAIELRYLENAMIGTTISVTLNDEVRKTIIDQVKVTGSSIAATFPIQRHYFGSWQKDSWHIHYRPGIDFQTSELAEAFCVPRENSEPCDVWWHGWDPEFGCFHFSTAELPLSSRYFAIFVNGIGVRDTNRELKVHEPGESLSTAFTLSIYDAGRNLRFNLSRTRVSLPDSLWASIRNSVFEDEICRRFNEHRTFLDRVNDGAIYVFSCQDALPLSVFATKGGLFLIIASEGSYQGAVSESLREIQDLFACIDCARVDYEYSGPDLWLNERFEIGGANVKLIAAFVGARREQKEATAGLPTSAVNCSFDELGLSEPPLREDRWGKFRVQAFRNGFVDAPVLNTQQIRLVQKLLDMGEVTNVGLFRVSAQTRDNWSAFAKTWRETLGERGVPINGEDRKALYETLAARFQRRISWYQTVGASASKGPMSSSERRLQEFELRHRNEIKRMGDE